MKIRVLVLGLCVSVLPAVARAQAAGQTGLVAGLPLSVGLIWHPSTRVALRPDVMLRHSSTETKLMILGGPTRVEGRVVTMGLSGLVFLEREGNVRTYLSPRVEFGRGSVYGTRSEPAPAGNSMAVSGSIGVQYSPVRRFGIYGEIGYGFTKMESTIQYPIATSTTTQRHWSTQSNVGVILYFGGS